MKSACVIAIGDELLNGFTVESNTQWIKEELSKTNVNVLKSIILPDFESSILKELEKIINENYDFLVISGGLGPTHDDITKSVLSNFFKSPLTIDEEHQKKIKKRFGSLYEKYKEKAKAHKIKKIQEMLSSQSMILKDFKPINNKFGTALGMLGEFKNTKVIVLPRVPKELKQMFRDEIIANYTSEKESSSVITLKTTGITESKLYLLLENVVSKNKKNFKFSFLPHFSGVNLRVLKLNKDGFMDTMINDLKEKITPYFYGQNHDTLESVVSNLLIKKNIKISIAESCTGGLLSKKLTDFSGSSKYMLGSVIAYSDDIKNSLLKVPNKILIENGAVSYETALIMSESVARIFNADLGISITGISGPSGGNDQKPIGLYYISIKNNENHFSKKFIFNINDRLIHREVAASTALNLIRLNLERL